MYVLITAIVMLVLVLWLVRTRKNSLSTTVPTEPDQQKILKLFDIKQTIQNDDVEQLLDVSDSTAQRYLGQMVESGRLIRHGKTGRGTHYTKN